MKLKGIKEIITVLNTRHSELAKIRNKLRDDVMDFETLLDDCDSAMTDIANAIQTLSQQQ